VPLKIYSLTPATELIPKQLSAAGKNGKKKLHAIYSTIGAVPQNKHINQQ